MRQEDAARVLVVRAVEEVLPTRVPPEALLEAHAAAGDLADAPGWIVRRATYLVEHVLGPYGEIVAHTRRALPAPWVAVGLAAAAGLAANYLGPTASIHAVWNPIVLLVVWNLAVYVALAARRVVARRARPAARPDAGVAAAGVAATPPAAARAPAAAAPPPAAAAPPYRAGVLERLLLGRVLAWLFDVRRRAAEGVEDAGQAARVGRRFAVLWWPLARPVALAWLRRLLHLAAIGIAAGAVAGMYVRGLFFAYRVVWRSTFVNDPEIVAVVLRALLGPAALLLGRPAPDAADVVRLLGPEGDPAGPWIHLYALSAALSVVVPRAVLALLTGRRMARAADDVALDLDDPYYRDLVERAWAVSPERVEAAIRTAVEDECGRFAGRLADFVCVELYDRRIVPRLEAFREQGGTLRDLEAALAAECDAFAPTLERELPHAQEGLERALVGRVRRLLGDDGGAVTPTPGGLVGEVRDASATAARGLGARVGGDVATVVSGVVTMAVGVVVGTVSGGFGEALGLALLVGLVESGPVGWVVGALAGVVVSGAALFLGREKLREGLRAVPLPASVLQVVLWRRRFDGIVADGRRKCADAVRGALATRIDPLAGRIAEHIWAGLRPVVGELQRPRVPRPPGG